MSFDITSGITSIETIIDAMKPQKKEALQFAVCINNAEYPASLDLHKIYRVLPDEDAVAGGDLRVIDERGEDCLHPVDWCVMVQLQIAGEQSLLRVA